MVGCLATRVLDWIYIYIYGCVIVCSAGWKRSWLSDCLIGRVVNAICAWLVGWLIVQMVLWLIVSYIFRLIGWWVRWEVVNRGFLLLIVVWSSAKVVNPILGSG